LKAIFWTRQEVGHLEQSDWRETNLAKAIQNGARLHGDEVEIRAVKDGAGPQVLDCDLVFKIGVKSRDWFRAYNAAGIPYCYFDKGYIRTRADEWLEYWRVSVNGHQPLSYVETASHDCKRADGMGLKFNPWKEPRGDAILVDGASGKHHFFHAPSDLKLDTKEELAAHATEVARRLIKRIRDLTQRPIYYRPKPSWKEATPIPEADEYCRGRAGVPDKEPFHDIRRAHAVVTYSSNLCFDSVLDGVPSVVLGVGITRPISSSSLEDLERPRLASEDERRQWLNNVAWTQFKPREYHDGTAWPIIRKMVECTPIKC
jgi:hypothetical protein